MADKTIPLRENSRQLAGKLRKWLAPKDDFHTLVTTSASEFRSEVKNQPQIAIKNRLHEAGAIMAMVETMIDEVAATGEVTEKTARKLLEPREPEKEGETRESLLRARMVFISSALEKASKPFAGDNEKIDFLMQQGEVDEDFTQKAYRANVQDQHHMTKLHDWVLDVARQYAVHENLSSKVLKGVEVPGGDGVGGGRSGRRSA